MLHDAHTDEFFMRRALDLARLGLASVEPNPMVGAVVVRDGEIVGEGYHQRYGEPHAEPNAIAAAGERCRGATLYVSLEPCTRTKKKTPPCCDAVIRAGFSRVVIGARDPVQEPAVPRLREAGIEVVTGVLQEDAEALIAPFLTLYLKQRPFVIAKWAMTLDGRIATTGGDSKWISCEASRERVHQWRSQINAVLIGAGTARRDDPLLTCRCPGGRNPLRIVIDPTASLATESRLVQTTAEAPFMIVCHESAPESERKRLEGAGCRVLAVGGNRESLDLTALLRVLGSERLTYLMVEGGAATLAHFFEVECVDEVRAFVAPRIAGGADAPGAVGGAGAGAMAEAIKLTRVAWERIGDDLLLTGRIAQPPASGATPRTAAGIS